MRVIYNDMHVTRIECFMWRHGGHVGVPQQWNGGLVDVPNLSSIIMQTAFSFVLVEKQGCWSRESKQSIQHSVSLSALWNVYELFKCFGGVEPLVFAKTVCVHEFPNRRKNQ